MPITIEQIKDAQEKLNTVQAAASDVNEVLVKTTEAILINAGGEVIIDITPEQKTALLAEYNARKAILKTAVDELL